MVVAPSVNELEQIVLGRFAIYAGPLIVWDIKTGTVARFRYPSGGIWGLGHHTGLLVLPGQGGRLTVVDLGRVG